MISAFKFEVLRSAYMRVYTVTTQIELVTVKYSHKTMQRLRQITPNSEWVMITGRAEERMTL